MAALCGFSAACSDQEARREGTTSGSDVSECRFLFGQEGVVETDVGDAEGEQGFDLGKEGIGGLVTGERAAVVAGLRIEHGVGTLQGGGIAAELGANAVDGGTPLAGFGQLRVERFLEREAIPDVRVADGVAHHLRSEGSDHDRRARLLDRAWVHDGAVGLVVPALVGGGFLSEELADQLEVFAEAGGALGG